MKIGINAIFFAPGEGGGIERYLRNLLRALQKIDRKNEYVLFTNKENTGTFHLSNNFIEYPLSVSARCRPSKILWEQLILPHRVARADLDVLLSPGNIAPLVCPCPSVVVLHDLVPFESPENFKWAESIVLRAFFTATVKRVDRIITVSDSSRRQILQRFDVPPTKISVIYEGCDEIFYSTPETPTESAHTKERLGIAGHYVLYTAATLPHKNMPGLLKAFYYLKKVHDIKLVLVIAGRLSTDFGNLLNLVKRLDITDDVMFTGHISDAILPSLYRQASLFVYPSFYEGFGLPILEAMASGTPVVASNTTSIPEVVGDAGLLVNPRNIQELGDAMAKVLKDEKQRDKLIARGRKRVQQFTWEKTARKVLNELSDLHIASANRDAK